MTDRFSPSSIFVGHLKGLLARDPRDGSRTSVDFWAIGIMLGIPSVAAFCVTYFDGTLGDPGFLIAAAALLTAGLLGTFAQLANWRDRLTSRVERFPRSERPIRYNVDVTAAHVSVASYISVVLTVVLVIGANTVNKAGDVVGAPAAVAAFLGSYLVLLLGIVIPSLYEAYAEVNDLDDSVSGLVSFRAEED